MAIVKCEMCGRDLFAPQGQSQVECQYCGSRQKVTAADHERQAEQMAQMDPLLRRAFLFLEDGAWDRADAYCERVLDQNPECAEAYLGKLLAQLQLHKKEDLANCAAPFDGNNNYRKILRFADPGLRAEMEATLDLVRSAMETAQCSVIENGILKKYQGTRSHVVIPGSVTTIGAKAFQGCESLTTVAIPDTVTEIAADAFEDCEALREIRLSESHPKYQAAGTCLLDRKQGAVLSCIRFQDLPTDGSARSIGAGVFRGKEQIVDIQIPEGVTAIENGAFADCGNLTSITLPRSLTEIAADALPHNPGLQIHVSQDHPAFCMVGTCLIQKQEKLLVFGADLQDLPDDGSVTGIGAYAFAGCELPEELELPACINRIGPNAFGGCPNPVTLTYYGNALEIGENAFGSNPENLTIIAYEESGAAQWARNNNITTLENKEMRRISISSLLEQGSAALQNGDWETAAGCFEALLKKRPKNARAYVFMALAKEHCHTLEDLVNKCVAACQGAKPEQLSIKEDAVHISEMVKKYSIPGYIHETVIRELYVCDLSYLSEVSGRQKQCQEVAAWWKNHPQLSWAEKFAREDMAEYLNQQKENLLAQLVPYVEAAKEAEAKNIAARKAAYDAHIAQADKEAERIYNEAAALRQRDYETWKEQASRETDPGQLKQLAMHFLGLEDYLDSQKLADSCRQRSAAGQEKTPVTKEIPMVAAPQKEEPKKEAPKKEQPKKERPKKEPLQKAAPKKVNKGLIFVVCAIVVAGILLAVLLPRLNTKGENQNPAQETTETALPQMDPQDETVAVEPLTAEEVAELQYQQAARWEAEGQLGPAAIAFGKLGDYADARQRSFFLWDRIAERRTLVTAYWDGTTGVAGVRQDGTVASAELDGFNLSDWSDVIAIDGDGGCIVGLKSDGTVLSSLRDEESSIDTSAWTDIVDIRYVDSWPGNFVMGLKMDGTVVATEACSVNLSGWTDVVKLYSGNTIAGLKLDGTVVTAGNSNFSQQHVSDWSDIVELKFGDSQMVGLRSDGTAVLAGGNGSHQKVVSEWTDITDCVISNWGIIVGLKSDGTVVHVEGGARNDNLYELPKWNDIEKIFPSAAGVIGITSDGSVVAAGYEQYGSMSFTDEWNDMVQVVSDWNNTRGLKADGTVLSIGSREFGARNTSDWTDIVAPITMEYCFRADGTLVHGDREKNALVADWTDMKLPNIPEAPFAPGGFHAEKVEETYDYAAAYQEAENLLASGDTARAAMAFGKLGDYEDARQRSMELWDKIAQRKTLAVGNFHTLILKDDGTVYGLGQHVSHINGVTHQAEGISEEGNLRHVDDWTDIIEVSAGATSSAGLRSDGTVAVVGQWQDAADEWKDIVDVEVGGGFLLGLKTDGTVVIAGRLENQSLLGDWTEIVAIEAGSHAVGLKADGTVVAVGSNACGECHVEAWTDIVKVSVGDNLTLGLTASGTVVAAGNGEDGQTDVSHWQDIREICCAKGNALAIGVKTDGTVVVAGKTQDWYDPTGWTDMLTVAAGANHLAGLKTDGTAVASGNTQFGQCHVYDLRHIQLPREPAN